MSELYPPDAPFLKAEMDKYEAFFLRIFLQARVAHHLAHGCDTPEKARELALVEWRVGVMGEKV